MSDTKKIELHKNIRLFNIKGYLGSKNIKSVDVYTPLGINKSYFSDILNHRRQPSMHLLFAIADYLECSFTELMITQEEYREAKQKQENTPDFKEENVKTDLK